jgi:hypothetical protein
MSYASHQQARALVDEETGAKLIRQMERDMKEYLRRRWRDSTGAGVEEQLDEVSADLPYELQSKMFDQLAAVSVAGAGLAVTLIGSLLRSAPPVVWLSVIFFGMAAVIAVSANSNLIDGLFRKKPTVRQSRLYAGLAIGLIGMAVGALSMSVYYDGKRDLANDAKPNPQAH